MRGAATARTLDSVGEVDDLRLYLDAAAREPLLTKEQEVQLAMTIERGEAAIERLAKGRLRSAKSIGKAEEEVRRGRRARRQFILANLRLVVSVARKYQNQGLPLLDLIQEGNIGLMRAVELFDWKKGFKFSTYATWWIRQAITRAIADRGRTIRLPVHVYEQVRKLHRTVTQIAQRTGREPSREEVAKAMDMTPEDIDDLVEASRREPTSIYRPVGEDTELIDLLEEAEDESPFDAVEDQLLREEVGQAVIAALESREQEVIMRRYGLRDGRPLSLREVGREMNLSGEMVRKIEQEALRKLRASDLLISSGG